MRKNQIIKENKSTFPRPEELCTIVGQKAHKQGMVSVIDSISTHILSYYCMESFEIPSYFWSVFSPNAGKYGPEITLYLDTFHAVCAFDSSALKL